jgi:virginiamycin B lyase
MRQASAMKSRMRATAAGALLFAAAAAAWCQQDGNVAAVLVPGPLQVSMTVFSAGITPGARPHDPLATRDGALWYTGQASNTLGRVDPRTGQVREYALKTPQSGPSGIVEDRRGHIWYAGSTAGLIGRLDPRTGDITEFKLPAGTGDPHTLLLDREGGVWFTAENANHVGRLDTRTGQVRLVPLPTPGARPHGMAFDPRGNLFVGEAGSNGVFMVTPSTMAVREFKLPDPGSRPRRVAVTPNNQVWYTDYARGRIGRLDVGSGEVKEWLSPSGPQSAPYGISAIGDTLWYSESGVAPNTVVRFDPGTEAFQSWAIPGGGRIVQNTAVTTEGDLVLASSLANAVTLVKLGR